MKTYLRLLSLKISSRLSYKLDFFTTLISSLLWSLASPLFIILLYQSGASYPDWNFNEILLFIGIYTALFGLGRAFFYNFFFNTGADVRTGYLELTLIKPVDELVLLLGKSFDWESLSEVLAGSLIAIYAFIQLSLSPNIFLFLVYIGLALLFYFSMILLISSLIMKYVQVTRLIEIVERFMDIASHPKNVYPRVVQTGFSIFIPLFIISYYPASALIGFELVYPFTIILTTLIFFMLSLYIWRKSIKNYTGAGG